MLQICKTRSLAWSVQLKSLYSTAVYLSNNVEPVKMAYASYEITESTQGPPPFIVMHGLFGSKANWNSLCKAFQKKTIPQRKVYAVDCRNHGDSPHSNQHTYEHLAEDIKALYLEHKINKACLLGHSMGGRGVMYFALTNPDLVQKIIVADISPIFTSPALKTMPALFEVMAKIKMPKEGPMSAAKVHIDKQLARRIEDKGLRAFIMTNVIPNSEGGYKWRVNLPALVKNFHNIASFPNSENLVYNGPAMFIGGGNSDYLPKRDHAQILKMFPNATFSYIEGAGHWLHSEKPNEFLKLTLDFLNQEELKT